MPIARGRTQFRLTRTNAASQLTQWIQRGANSVPEAHRADAATRAEHRSAQPVPRDIGALREVKLGDLRRGISVFENQNQTRAIRVQRIVESLKAIFRLTRGRIDGVIT